MQKINLTLHFIGEVQMLKDLKDLKSLSESVFYPETYYHGKQAAQASFVLLLPEDHTVHWPDTGEWRTWGLDCTRQNVSSLSAYLSTPPPHNYSHCPSRLMDGCCHRGFPVLPWAPPSSQGNFPDYRQAPDTNRNLPASDCHFQQCLRKDVNVLHHTPQVVWVPLHGSSTT